nr:hypothetical protein [Streptomyces sp. MP131-18]
MIDTQSGGPPFSGASAPDHWASYAAPSAWSRAGVVVPGTARSSRQKGLIEGARTRRLGRRQSAMPRQPVKSPKLVWLFRPPKWLARETSVVCVRALLSSLTAAGGDQSVTARLSKT